MTPLQIYIAIGSLLASLLGGGIIGWHERALRVPAELTAQVNTDHLACEASQKLTKDANDALQKDRDTIARKLAALKLQHPSTGLHVASSSNIPTSGAGHAGQNGTVISADSLRDYAAEAEQYRAQFLVCSQLLDAERKPLP